MNKPTLRQIDCFLEICRDFNFTRAATRLHMAQPPLSRQIRELEQNLEVKLFERTSRTVKLTQAGHAFLEQVCTIPQTINKAILAAQSADHGQHQTLRIGFVSAILNEQVYSLFRQIRQTHPTIQLELVDGNPNQLLNDLTNELLDGAFLGVKIPKLSRNLKQIHWRTEPLVVCLPKEHPLADKPVLSLEDLHQQSFVTLQTEVAPSYQGFIQDLFLQHSVAVKTVQQTGSVTSLISLVIAGNGLALLPKSAITHVEDHLSMRPIQEKTAVTQEVFVFRTAQESHINPILNLLVHKR